ncbi:MAG TPA: hypothetical protein VGM37_08520 [Armatimonadota bacterium]|jgi:hypothetical protein
MISLWASVVLPRASATTKGLNQIVTPDIQPVGVLSLSLQGEHQGIGNAIQVQMEYGVTRRFEVATFGGFRPRETSLAAEYGLVARGPYLLATGFLNWTDRGGKPQTFLEGGYFLGRHRLVAGAVRVESHTQAMGGYAYQATPRLLLQTDYQSGSGNAATAGFTYSLSPQVQINTAAYYTNDSPHRALPYAVVSWNIQVR